MVNKINKEQTIGEFTNIINDFHGHPEFVDTVLNMLKLHSKKNKQYATEEEPLGNFKLGAILAEKVINPPDGTFTEKERQIAYALILATKQVLGSMEILAEKKTDTPDSLNEKLGDVAVYNMICMILNNVLGEEEA